jgi:hypothetical protein
MNRQGVFEILPDSGLALVVGGSAAPKPGWKVSENQKLGGAALTGAITGVVRGAAAGPAGMATGALVGAATGMGAYAATAYATGGNRAAILKTPQPMPMASCHRPPMPMAKCHGKKNDTN